MTVDKRIQEAIDVCRPDTDDLQFPELTDVAAQINNDARLAQLVSRVQSTDKRIIEVMGQGRLPEGIEQRLLDRLELAKRQGSSAEMQAVVSNQVETRGDRVWWRSRRGLLLMGLAAVLLIGATTGILSMGNERLMLENLDGLAEQWHQTVHSEDGWQPDPPPSGYRIPKRIKFRTGRWKSFACPADRSAVAYNLTDPGAPNLKATLFVIRTTIDGLDNSPPTAENWTMGRSISAWQSGEFVYVIVIEGRQKRYFKYVDTTPPTSA